MMMTSSAVSPVVIEYSLVMSHALDVVSRLASSSSYAYPSDNLLRALQNPRARRSQEIDSRMRRPRARMKDSVLVDMVTRRASIAASGASS